MDEKTEIAVEWFDAPSDDELYSALRRGDSEAFARIVERHKPWLERILHRWSLDHDTVDEGVQEVFLRLWMERTRLSQSGNLGNWLYTVTRNWWRNRARASARSAVSRQELGRSVAFYPVVEGPELTVWQRYKRYVVNRAVARLPEGQREVFELVQLEGMTCVAAAGVLGIPEGTVKSRMFHATRKLRDSLRTL